MTVTDLFTSIEFIDDSQGNPKTLLDRAEWEQILALLQANYLTTDEVAQRIQFPRQTVETWVAKGILTGVQLNGQWLVSTEALARFASLETILNDLDAEAAPLEPERAAEIVSQGREQWTWVGKK